MNREANICFFLVSILLAYNVFITSALAEGFYRYHWMIVPLLITSAALGLRAIALVSKWALEKVIGPARMFAPMSRRPPIESRLRLARYAIVALCTITIGGWIAFVELRCR